MRCILIFLNGLLKKCLIHIKVVLLFLKKIKYGRKHMSTLCEIEVITDYLAYEARTIFQE
jgi:hypothetical protein